MQTTVFPDRVPLPNLHICASGTMQYQHNYTRKETFSDAQLLNRHRYALGPILYSCRSQHFYALITMPNEGFYDNVLLSNRLTYNKK